MTPRLIELDLPSEARRSGELYDTDDPAYLTEDILQIELPNRIFVDVGWYPDYDPAGRFYVTAFRETWEDRIFQKTAKTADALARILKDEVTRLARLPITCSRSEQEAIIWIGGHRKWIDYASREWSESTESLIDAKAN